MVMPRRMVLVLFISRKYPTLLPVAILFALLFAVQLLTPMEKPQAFLTLAQKDKKLLSDKLIKELEIWTLP